MSSPAPFAIGTSTSVAASSNVDMSLDDLIASRRTAKKSNANAARQTGQNKARRSAAMAARRGIANQSGKSNKMEEERQVRRVAAATGRGGARGNNNANKNNNAARNNSRPAPRISDVKARAKARLSKARAAIAQQKGGTNNAKGPVAAPTQQAVSAAARAMKDFGFKPPKGMQMQISFVPKKNTAAPAAGGGRNNNRGGRGGGGATGGGGRGGRGRGGRR